MRPSPPKTSSGAYFPKTAEAHLTEVAFKSRTTSECLTGAGCLERVSRKLQEMESLLKSENTRRIWFNKSDESAGNRIQLKSSLSSDVRLKQVYSAETYVYGLCNCLAHTMMLHGGELYCICIILHFGLYLDGKANTIACVYFSLCNWEVLRLNPDNTAAIQKIYSGWKELLSSFAPVDQRVISQ